MAVVIETTLGDLTVDLFLEQRPRASLNFLKLCKMKYYNFSLFHSIQSGFIAQTGDPTATGSGGESIWGLLEGEDKRYFTAERVPRIRHSDVGMLSMVCAGDSLVGSQFFFTLGPDLDSLDSMHCVIGVVTEGHDVLRLLNEVICDEGFRPYRDVRITHTVILEDPFDDPKGLHVPLRSPSPCAERLVGGRIAPDEEIDETQGKTLQEINELIEDKEAKARATILEIVGDLPDADVAPPENVLFVCKLNPVTTDSDLEIIFSRFGKIVNCEIIRDRKTGDSLQYAFIEFEDKKSCESAYFKMDNVLIDDRRIHVDFSQSVSKVKYFGKGRVKHMNENDTSNIDVTRDRKRQRSRSKDIDKKKNKEWNFNDPKKNICNSRDRDEQRHHRANRRRSGSRSRDRYQRNHDKSRRSRDRTRKSPDKSRSGERHRKSRDRDDKEKNRNKDKDEKEKSRNQDRKTRSSNHKEQEYREDIKKQRLKKSKSKSPIREPHSSKRGNSRQKSEPKITTSPPENTQKGNYAHDNVNNSSKGKCGSDSDDNTDASEKITHHEKIGEESTKPKKMSQSGHNHSDDIAGETPSSRQSSSKIPVKQKEKCHKEQKEKKDQNTKDSMKCSMEESKNKLKTKSDKLKKKVLSKKKRKHSTSSSSSDSSSTSSSSDSSSSESDRRRKKSAKKRRESKKKRNYSTSSSSSPSESSSSSESDSSSDSSSTSSSSEGEVRKKIKLAKTKNTPVKKYKTDKKKT